MGNAPPSIRILPMNRRAEFPDCKTAEELQQTFFLEDLPFRPNGHYRFYKAGLSAEPGTVVLFQCDGKIIASAILRNRVRFDQPDAKGYEGCLYFDVNSIEVFDPLDRDVLGRIWPKVKRLGRVKWSLDTKRYEAFKSELKNIEKPKA